MLPPESIVPVQGLNHVNLRAPRPLLDALKDFYCQVLGFTSGERPPFASFGYWLYAGGRPILHLSEANLAEIRDTEAVAVFDHIAFDCVDPARVESALCRLNLPYETARVPATGDLQIFLRDPAGTKVELNFGNSA